MGHAWNRISGYRLGAMPEPLGNPAEARMSWLWQRVMGVFQAFRLLIMAAIGVLLTMSKYFPGWGWGEPAIASGATFRSAPSGAD